MTYVSLTKFEIAEEQLFHAIEIYLDGKMLISSITLSGAAEEILGKLVKRNNKVNALGDKVKSLCELHEVLFDEPANPDVYINLKNKTRNELKHICKAENIDVDIEQEAVSLIRRGIKNYRKLKATRVKLFALFESESVRRRGLLAGIDT